MIGESVRCSRLPRRLVVSRAPFRTFIHRPPFLLSLSRLLARQSLCFFFYYLFRSSTRSSTRSSPFLTRTKRASAPCRIDTCDAARCPSLSCSARCHLDPPSRSRGSCTPRSPSTARGRENRARTSRCSASCPECGPVPPTASARTCPEDTRHKHTPSINETTRRRTSRGSLVDVRRAPLLTCLLLRVRGTENHNRAGGEEGAGASTRACQDSRAGSGSRKTLRGPPRAPTLLTGGSRGEPTEPTKHTESVDRELNR